MPADPAPRGRRPPVPANASDSTTPGRGTGPSRRPTGSSWSPTCPDCPPSPESSRNFPTASPPPSSSRSAERDDLDYLPRHPDVTVIPSIGTGNGHAPSKLAQLSPRTHAARRRWLLLVRRERRPNPAPCASTCAGHGWTIDQYDITGYWRFDSETLGRQSSPLSKTRSSRSTSAPSPTARATRWPPRSSTRRSNRPGSRPP